jgi:sodium/hydrogen exchanger 8
MHAVKTLASEWGCCDRFQVKKKHFFLNVVAIMLSGVVVVFYFFAIISAGCSFVFPKLGLGKLFIQDYLARGGGTIFSATDSVCTLQVVYPSSILLYKCSK